MSEAATHKKMIKAVAQALGNELLNQVAFVGGCTTGLLITDEFSLEQVRHTDDVDLIVHVIGHAGWKQLQGKLRAKSFQDILNEPEPEQTEGRPSATSGHQVKLPNCVLRLR